VWGGSTPLVSVAWGGTPDVAIPIAMTPAEHVPLAEVKNRLSEVVDRLEHDDTTYFSPSLRFLISHIAGWISSSFGTGGAYPMARANRPTVK
jgi:hypothetical protein